MPEKGPIGVRILVLCLGFACIAIDIFLPSYFLPGRVLTLAGVFMVFTITLANFSGSQDDLSGYFFFLIILDIIFSFFITLAIFQIVNSISPQSGGFSLFMSIIFGPVFLVSFIFGSFFIEPLTDKLHNK